MSSHHMTPYHVFHMSHLSAGSDQVPVIERLSSILSRTLYIPRAWEWLFYNELSSPLPGK